jgi:hypothetical protein
MTDAVRLADMPDDETLLATYTEKVSADEYVLGGRSTSRANALGAIKLNLAVGQRPTTIVTSDFMLAVIARLEAVEDNPALQVRTP